MLEQKICLSIWYTVKFAVPPCCQENLISSEAPFFQAFPGIFIYVFESRLALLFCPEN